MIHEQDYNATPPDTHTSSYVATIEFVATVDVPLDAYDDADANRIAHDGDTLKNALNESTWIEMEVKSFTVPHVDRTP